MKARKHDLPNETWREMLAAEMAMRGDSPANVEHCTLTTAQLDEPMEGEEKYDLLKLSFTVWTHTRVYFPSVYDCSYSVGSAPRNPCDERTEAIGGGGY